MARIKINDIESASFASESYLNDLQELEMISVKGGWWPLVAVLVRSAASWLVRHIITSYSDQSPSQPAPNEKSVGGGWYDPYGGGQLHETA